MPIARARLHSSGQRSLERPKCRCRLSVYVSVVPRQNVDGGLIHADGARSAYREVVAFPALADPHGDVRTTERNVARQVHDEASFRSLCRSHLARARHRLSRPLIITVPTGGPRDAPPRRFAFLNCARAHRCLARTIRCDPTAHPTVRQRTVLPTTEEISSVIGSRPHRAELTFVASSALRITG